VSHASLQPPRKQRAKTPASSNYKTTARERIGLKVGSVDVSAKESEGEISVPQKKFPPPSTVRRS